MWAETNCYADVWIELAHALGYEPNAALPFTFAIDFEGDQWTFFKFPLEDLYDLFGLKVQELMIWGPLATRLEEQIGRGHPVLVEPERTLILVRTVHGGRGTIEGEARAVEVTRN